MSTTPHKISNSAKRARANVRTTPTWREERFVAEYLIDQVGSAAAIRAGYSPRSADKIAHELKQRPAVKALLKKALAAQQKRTLITADQVLKDIQDFGDKAAKAGEFHAALRSRQLLGQHYKLFTEKHEHGGIGGGPVLFQITPKEADL